MRAAGDHQPTKIMPQLSVRHGRAAIEFYKAAFGATEDYRVGGTDDHEEVVAQLSVGEASFWVSDESPPNRLAPGTGRRSLRTHWEIGRPLIEWPPTGKASQR